MLNRRLAVGKIKFKILLLSLILMGATSEMAFGQDNKKKTSINFEDELIQGEVKKPELLYLLQKKQFNFKRLIKLRENFLPEMRRTAEEVQQSGSRD